MGTECKPIITVSGEIRNGNESTEEPRKIVYVNASFVPLDPELFEERVNPSETLLNDPILHTYWIECANNEVYKQSVKEGISSWLNSLKKCGIHSDWLIILLESPDSRKSSKLLPRNSVLDKIKNEVGEKQRERCISILDPSKTDSRSLESWQNLLLCMRTKVLVAYNTVLGRFEENMRKQREMRNNPAWNFCSYFILQEELAFVYEMLGVFDESLVQYDELDALFTQFILNTNVGDTPNWLKGLTGEFNDWSGLSLNISVNHDLRKLIKDAKPSILDIRNYLFSRQCAMLLLMNKPWEVAKREYFLLASLWNYAREKLKELGQLCGLFPQNTITSEQLHMVVQISSGIRDTHYLQSSQPPRANPVDKLKEALSSKEAFRKYYLELSELAISTYKHINRIRSARLVGLDLALFYIEAKQTYLASTFLQDALKSYKSEGWELASKETQIKLIECFGSHIEPQRYVRSCALIACSISASEEERKTYLTHLMDFTKKVSMDSPLVTDADGVFSIVSCKIKTDPNQKIISGSKLELEITFDNALDSEVDAREISVILNYSEAGSIKERSKVIKSFSSVSSYPNKNRASVCRSSSSASSLTKAKGSNVLSLVNDEEVNTDFEKRTTRDFLDIRQELDSNQDRTFNSARLVCENINRILRRKDSSGYILKDGCSVEKSISEYRFVCSNVLITKGLNTVILSTVVPNKIEESESFTSVYEEPEVSLVPLSRLLIGCEQTINLIINCKSAFWGENNCISIDCSTNLFAKSTESDDMASHLSLTLPSSKPYDIIQIPILVLSNFGSLKSVQHQITVTTSKLVDGIKINKGSKSFSFTFDPPFSIVSFSIKTAMIRKFVCLSLIGTEQALNIHEINFQLKNNEEEIHLKDLQSKDSFMIDAYAPCNYLCELIQDNKDWDGKRLGLDVDFLYEPLNQKDPKMRRIYNNNLELKDLKTLYLVNSKLDPYEGELIQASSMCSLVVTIELTYCAKDVSIMYEVLVEQGEWAVCSQETGVLNMDNDNTKQNITVEVMPLISGHLNIPYIKLSKYIPSDSNSSEADTKHLPSRSEPFSDGQVYNINRFDQYIFNSELAIMENTLQSRPPSLVSRQFIYKATWKEMYILLMDKSVSYMSKVGTALQNLYPYVSPCMVNRFQIVSNADYSKDDNNNLSIDEDEAIAVVIMMVFSYAYSTKDLRRTDIMQRYTNVMRALNRKVLTKCEFEREIGENDIPINSVKLEDLPNYEDILNGTTPCPIAKAIRSQLAELFRDFQQTSLKLGMKIVDQLEKNGTKHVIDLQA
ncbi:TRAPPC10 [Lepeophtheirus salmonis]|uniref:TRAPPC10 n=1 Tax=Lepeophtheirus salmonis TaxID=72036 RepID=A0A7R8H412_LEPSM|nr:TRAPPC10 [Lepeophtheirus salmonis]CAF2850126.1 TRAPPC10 [Lepeophtheirus salmonis]